MPCLQLKMNLKFYVAHFLLTHHAIVKISLTKLLKISEMSETFLN